MDRLLSRGVENAPPQLKAVIELLHPDCSPEKCLEVLGESGEIFDTARMQNVAGIIAHRWMAQLAQARPEEELQRWHGLVFSAVAGQAREEPEVARLLDALSTAGAVPAVMRGLWLAYAVYPDPSLRPHSDIDLLLPLEALNAGIEALGRVGYETHGGNRTVDIDAVRVRLRRGYRWHISAFRPASEANWLSIDVHVDLHLVGQGWWPYGPTPEELFERTEPWELLGQPALAMELPLAMLCLVENMARHAVAREGYGNWLVRLYDMLLLAQRMTGEQWERLVDDAVRFRLNLQLAIFLGLVEQMWGPQWPPGVLTRMKQPAAAYRLARLAASRPAWLGHRGRCALLQAAATLTLPAALVYVARNALFGLNPQ